MQSAYQLQYVEFLNLREKYKQQVQELNNLRTEKTTMLIKINDLISTRESLRREANSHALHSEVPN
jgi:hypothetical protein